MTKQEKHNFYVRCLNDIQHDKFRWCCAAFIDYIDWTKENFLSFDFKKEFFELFELRTIKNAEKCPVWFNNKEERIIALKQCIEQTK